MTSYDGNESEMSTILTDRHIERLLTGRSVPEAGALAIFVDELRADGQAHPDELMVTRHVAACADAAHLARDLTPDRDAVRRRTRPARRRRTVMAALTSSLLAKVLAGSVALAAVGGTAATTGNLPDPAQSAVAEAASRIGISLPSPEDGAESETRGVPVADQAAELEGSDDPCTAALDLAELAAGEEGQGPAEEAEENACQEDAPGIEDPDDAGAQVARESVAKDEELGSEGSGGASDAAEQAQEDPAGLAEERSGGAAGGEKGRDASSAGAGNAPRAEASTPDGPPIGGP
jgi:hypothetical protein